MNEPILLKDTYHLSKDRIVLTREELQIPGLEMFGRHTIKSALSPLAAHYHPHCYEITFVIKGAITFSVDDTDYPLTGGDIFITFPDEVHSTNLAPISLSELIWFQIDISKPEQLLFLDRLTSLGLANQMGDLKRMYFRMTPSMAHLVDDAFKAACHQNPPQLTASYLSLILQLLTMDLSTSELLLSDDMQRSVDYITNHLTEQISLDELAGMCGLSVSAYKQKFKHQMGITPRSYINMQKIELSKQLLNSGCGITDTAMKVGFNTSSYFTTVFKKYAFQSPTDYIHQIK